MCSVSVLNILVSIKMGCNGIYKLINSYFENNIITLLFPISVLLCYGVLVNYPTVINTGFVTKPFTLVWGHYAKYISTKMLLVSITLLPDHNPEFLLPCCWRVVSNSTQNVSSIIIHFLDMYFDTMQYMILLTSNCKLIGNHEIVTKWI